MECDLLAPIQYFNPQIDKVKILPHVFIFQQNSRDIKLIFTGNQAHVNRIGTAAIEDINSSANFVLTASVEELVKLSGSNDRKQHSYILATELLRYLLSLWFVKDNSCFCNATYLLTEQHQHIFGSSLDTYLSNSRGEYKTVDFTIDEIVRAFTLSQALINLFGEKTGIFPDTVRSKDESGSVLAADHRHFTTNRIERAFLMLLVARSTVELSMKISFYMSTLECMFTTDSSEISNKIVQRVTLFVGGSVDEMLKNKDVIKKAYSVRSGFLHGSNPKAKLTTKDSLVEISTAIDHILRVVFLKVVETESKVFLSKDPKDLDNYFDSFVYR